MSSRKDMSRYVAALIGAGKVLNRLERALAGSPDNVFSDRDIKTLAAGPGYSDEQVLLALEGLSSLGMVKRFGQQWVLSRDLMGESEGFRQGVHIALSAVSTRVDARLVASMPKDSPGEIANLLKLNASELRSTIVNLIAASHEEIIMASPFWDRQTVDEFVPLLRARLEDDVRIALIGRPASGGSVQRSAIDTIQAELANRDRFHWYNVPNELNNVPFHFKAMVMDGVKAYVGSANFTVRGLRQGFELGVLLEGPLATSIHSILSGFIGLQAVR